MGLPAPFEPELLDFCPKALRDAFGFGQGTILQKDAELVSSEARQGVAGSSSTGTG